MESIEHSKPIEWKATVAILGARMHYAVPTILARNGKLDKFFTDLYLSGGYLRNLCLRSPIGMLRRMALRYEPQLPYERVKAFPMLGMLYWSSLQIGAGEKTREKIFELFASWFGRVVSRRSFDESNVIYGVNAVSLEIFNSASKHGLTCVLEQCSSPYEVMNKLYEEEYAMWPDWETAQSAHFSMRLAKRENKEWKLADVILAGSPFVIENLVKLGVPSRKCKLVPYAVDVTEFCMKDRISARPKVGQLNVLFVGGVGVRKGIQYLYKALGEIQKLNITTRAAGSILVKPEISYRLLGRMELMGLIPHSEVRHLLKWADVLVSSSVSEGSALVTYEALAAGVPVIATPNSGSPVQDGVSGFIVPNRNAEAIAERLELLAQNPMLRQEMSLQARMYAEKNLSWNAYSVRLLKAIESAIRDNAN